MYTAGRWGLEGCDWELGLTWISKSDTRTLKCSPPFAEFMGLWSPRNIRLKFMVGLCS